MDEQVEQQSREEKIRERQNLLKGDIHAHIVEIHTVLDSLTALIDKKAFQDVDLEGAFDIMDAIREQTDAIEELLFDLRDTVR